MYFYFQPPSAKVEGNSYLHKWATEMKTKTTQKTRKPQTASSAENDSLKTLFGTKNQYPLPASPVISETSLRQLQQLMYAKQVDQAPQAVGTLPSKTMETHISAAREKIVKLKKEQDIKSDLSDVSLDD